MFTKLRFLTTVLSILCLCALSVRAQEKSTSDVDPTYDQLVDDYIRMDNELTAAKDSLHLEKKLRRNEQARADNCERNAKQAKNKAFWGSVKRTAQDICIGIVIGVITIIVVKK